MSRLREELLERVVDFGDRGLQLADALNRKAPRRNIDQIAACFTSVGANVYEAHEAMSERDFCKALGISIKEASESRYWLRIVARREWVPRQRLDPLETECVELIKILGAIIFKTKRRTPPRRKP